MLFNKKFDVDLKLLYTFLWKQDLEVSVEEFKNAVGKVCVGKSYADFPLGFKRFIDSSYLTVDVDGKCPKNVNISPTYFASRPPLLATAAENQS